MTTRRRLPADERRRQLVAIGLSKLKDLPIQDLSMDEVAEAAGISRGLLFHYFPTKTDFYLTCIGAAARRMLRNTAPDDSSSSIDQVDEMVRRTLEQIDRRRNFYLRLVREAPSESPFLESVREVNTDRVMTILGLDARLRPTVRGWWAYVEDLALTWSGDSPATGRPGPDAQSRHCQRVLQALLEVEPAVEALADE